LPALPQADVAVEGLPGGWGRRVNISAPDAQVSGRPLFLIVALPVEGALREFDL
jgi:hypothetical protein